MTRRACLSLALLALCAAGGAGAQVHRCVVQGKVVYQQSACAGGDSVGEKLAIDPAPAPAASAGSRRQLPRPAAGPDAVPLPPTPGKSELEQLADACLDWYRPRLRDPRGAYHREARLDKGVLSLVVYATNRRGGYVSQPAACEFRAGKLDDSWTSIHAKRRGW